MFDLNHKTELIKRRTFAIISHPDAGKTTVTEKMLFFGKVVRIPGTIKSRGSGKYAKSDWMDIEKKRGISVTTSVMQFTYKNVLINLLDTPGHQDFSEDTYRILTAVDCCLIIIDAAKGIEERTKKLMEVARIRNTPVITFINKLDRDSRDPIELLDQIEKELKLFCVPITWPIDCGKNFKGVYHIHDDAMYFYKNQLGKKHSKCYPISSFSSNIVSYQPFKAKLPKNFHEDLSLIIDVYSPFNKKHFLKGYSTPVFFGSALGNFGVDHVLESLIKWAPSPLYRSSNIRHVSPYEKKFTGFVFKIQANMDLKHRDRMAFIRIVSGQYTKGMKLKHIRVKKTIKISEAFSFLAGERLSIEKAYPGDVIGIHNHGTIKIGDTFTEGEEIKFIGMPSFAPEIFRKIYLKNPLKQKQLIKGLNQLSEEGAVQVFRLLNSNDLILGAIGILQFDVVIERLKIEYNIAATYKNINVSVARWIKSENTDLIKKFVSNHSTFLACDSFNNFIYLAPNSANLNISISQNPDIFFDKIRN